VDSGDEDLASFFYYLGLAGENASPRRKKRLSLLTPEYLLGIPAFSRNFFEELFGRLGEGAVLVLDGCHEIAASAPLHAALTEGLSRLPKSASLLLLSRGAPPPAYARFRTHGEMEVVGWDELRLTLEEFSAITRLRGFEDRGGEALRHLHGQLNGWAAGLQMFLEAARTQDISLSRLEEMIPEEIFDYFGGAVFDRLDAETRDFLLKTSFLPSMTAAMAEELTGHPRAGRLLSFLHRKGDFTEKRAQAEAVYQYHPLFRAFLLEKAEQSLAREDLGGVQRAAAGLLARAGRPEEAAGLLCQALDWDGLIGLTLAHAQELLRQGRNQTLEGWFRALPKPRLEEAPWLLYWQGAARLPFAPAEAQVYFERAFSTFREQGEAGPGLLLSWAGVATAICFAFSDFHFAEPWLERLSDLVGRPEDLPPGDVGSLVASGVLFVLSLRAPDLPGHSAWESYALAVEPDTSDLACRVNILGNLVFLNFYRGRPASAQALLERLKTVAGTDAVSPLSKRFALHFEGMFHFAYGDLEESMSAFRRALEIGEASGIHLLDTPNLIHLAGAELVAGDVAEARKCLGQMERRLPFASPWDRSAYRLLKGRIHLIEGELEPALQEARESLRLSQSVGELAVEIISLLLAAEVFHCLGNRREALRNLMGALRLSRRGMRYLEFSCLLLAARMHFDSGRRDRALAALQRAMELGRETGVRRLWLFHGPVLAALCTQALEAGIEVAYVHSLIRYNQLDPPAQLQAPELWPWPVRICTLGAFEVFLGGEPLRAPGKAQRRPLALLKALLAFGGRNVPQPRLSDALWPDADGDAAHGAFATTLHRLRKLLGVKDALVFQEGLLSLHPRLCWVDAWALERLLGEAESGWKAAPPEGKNGCPATEKADRALRLYKGSFLPEEVDEPWAVHPRERLRGRFLRGAEALGTHLEESGRWNEAAERYQRALEVDPLIERLYSRLMICHEELGQTSEALATFERCRRLLQRSLGVEPSVEVRALADRIRLRGRQGEAVG
jgi:ATP/maltotriose-dependent transcriptional regulator MalT/DNA-binding SARP family transcriptional activator